MSDGDFTVQAAAEEPAVDIRHLAFRTALSLAILFAILLAAGLLFERELAALAVRAEHAFGLAGLVLHVFLADSFTLPIPPDIALIIVANGPRRDDWFWIVPLLGCISTFGGVLGYALGVLLTRLPSVARLRGIVNGRYFSFVQRYGWIAVLIGALTPVPFSMTCYAAGALRIPLRGFLFACSLRIPRFVAYYLVFAYATRLSELLGTAG